MGFLAASSVRRHVGRALVAAGVGEYREGRLAAVV
jgi:hypothetical protein